MKQIINICIILIVLFCTENLNAMKRKKEEPEKGAEKLFQPTPTKKSKPTVTHEVEVKTLKELSKDFIEKNLLKDALVALESSISQATIQPFIDKMLKLPEELRSELIEKPLHYGNTLLHMVTNPHDVEQLIGLGANPNAQNFDDQTVFNYYIIQGKLAAAHKLLELLEVKLDISPDNSGITPLMNALKQGDIKLAEEIIKITSQLDELERETIINSYNNGNSNRSAQSALNLAIRIAPKLIPSLLNNYADPNAKYPLIVAAHYNPDVIQLLIDKGALVNEQDPLETTALMVAAETNPNSVKILLKNNADMYLENNFGENAGDIAIEKNRIDVVEQLLDAGFNIDHQTSAGTTLLMTAAQFVKPSITKTLLDRHASVNIRNDDDESALNYALSQAKNIDNNSPEFEPLQEVIILLLHHGALINNNDMEKAKSNSTIFKLLQEYQKKQNK